MRKASISTMLIVVVVAAVVWLGGRALWGVVVAMHQP